MDRSNNHSVNVTQTDTHICMSENKLLSKDASTILASERNRTQRIAKKKKPTKKRSKNLSMFDNIENMKNEEVIE